MVVLVVSFTCLLGVAATSASADDITGSYGSLRTGWDPNEPGLAPSSVSASDFGQLFSAQVDGQVYAQPVLANGTLIAATENNKVYGLDPATGAQRWAVDLGPAWPAATLRCGDLVPTIGVTATPVYDRATNAVYVTSKVNLPDSQHPRWEVHALDVTTGAERDGFPMTIHGSPTNDPTGQFNPETAMQRPALLLLDGVVYIGFASHCDYTPYVGYVVGVDATNGTQTTMWATEANASNEGGIWQSGSGLVSDGPGRIEFATGNGVAPAPGPGDSPPGTLGESVVRLAVGSDGALSAQSFFSPHDNTKLNQDDADLGSGGPMALPPSFGTSAHPHLLVQVGKDGRIYLLDADHLGGSGQGPGGGDDVLDVAGPFNGVWGHPAFWGGDGGYVYSVENNGPLRALKYSVSGDTASLTSVGTTSDDFGYTSGSPVVTSSGNTSGTALVWAVYSSGPTGANAQLRAYDALPQNGVMQLRYSAPIGTAVKFATPGTDGGRVYVGSRDGHVIGFGRPTTAIIAAKSYDFGPTAVGSTGNAIISVTANRAMTINKIAVAAPFSVMPPTLPATLSEGQRIDLKVGYTPGTWGGTSATVNFTTDAGTAGVDLHGTGTRPGLGADPSGLTFGQVRTGAAKQLGVDIVNTGTEPETIDSVVVPAAPFSVESVPSQGTSVSPGTSVVIPVTYTPTGGSDSGVTNTDQLVITGSAGSVTVPLTGVALTGKPTLTLAPASLDFGVVDVGQSVKESFEISNTGTVPLTITKAKAPAGVFSTSSPLAEGQVIAPGDVIHQSVTFTPVDALPATAQYLITGDDGESAKTVQLTGNADPINAYYQQLGGSRGSFLSDPVSGEYRTAGDGMAQDFRGGSIYWSPATGPHALRGAILAHYKELGGPASSLGYPTSDEHTTPDGIGRYNHFNGSGGASIYWTPNTGAWSIHGAIRAHWAAMGWERSPLGYPTTDEYPISGGRRNDFATGTLSWRAADGALTTSYN